MIIIEGPDGSGKTTLINRLNFDRRRLKSIRGGVGGTRFNGSGDGVAGWGGNDPALLAYTRKVIEAGTAPIAYDRFHLSERVYGPILRAKQELSDGDLELLTAFLRETRVKVVMCLPPLAVSLANVMQNGRERPHYQTEEFLQEAYAEFERLAPWATIVYDYTRHDLPIV
jgi:thymidylate kinase